MQEADAASSPTAWRPLSVAASGYHANHVPRRLSRHKGQTRLRRTHACTSLPSAASTSHAMRPISSGGKSGSSAGAMLLLLFGCSIESLRPARLLWWGMFAAAVARCAVTRPHSLTTGRKGRLGPLPRVAACGTIKGALLLEHDPTL